MKKILALVLTLMLVLGMTAALAAGETTYTITINKDSTDKAAHTYGAYQLFKGKLEVVNGTKVLSDISWGDNVNSSSFITELKKISAFSSLADDADAKTVAKAISDQKLATDAAVAQDIAEAFNKALTGDPKATVNVAANAASGTLTGLVAGYYLVKDTQDVSGEGAKTRFIMEVVSNVEVTEKADVPTLTKKVKDKDDGTGTVSDWQDAADYDIGDSIPYQITGTLPSRFEEFDTFKTYTITDTLSAGLTAPSADDITIMVGTTDVKSHFDIDITGTAKTEQVITISLKSGEDLRKWTSPKLTAASTFVVTYDAVLNDAAVIGSAGNPNTARLVFSNNPNSGGDGTGTTPDDKVTVFTYEIKALKVQPTGTGLTQDEYDALDAAQKKNYVKIGNEYFATTALEGAGFTLYKKVNGEWTQVGNEITGVTTFEFKGTDAGEYKLVETTVPKGFNKAEDVIFTVVAEYETDSADPKLTKLVVTPDTAVFTVTVTAGKNDGTDAITTDGIAEGKIVNQSGSTLPSTGGIGTTLFYVGGGILVLLAVVMLVTKRRMSGND